MLQNKNNLYNNKKSLWPIGILLVILIGVVLIIFSVRISKRQNIDSNMTYDVKKNDMDVYANEFLGNQSEFESVYRAFIGLNSKEIVREDSKISDSRVKKVYSNEMKSPFFASPVPRVLPDSKDMLHGGDNIYLILESKNLGSKLSIESVSLEASRILPDGKNVEKNAYVMELSESDEGKIIYVAHNISLKTKGYYQVDFKIKLRGNKRIVAFQKWVFNER